MGSPVRSSGVRVRRFRMWFATTPWVRGLRPVTRLTWVGHVVVGNTASMPAATTPRSARRRSVGTRACGSRQ